MPSVHLAFHMSWFLNQSQNEEGMEDTEWKVACVIRTEILNHPSTKQSTASHPKPGALAVFD